MPYVKTIEVHDHRMIDGKLKYIDENALVPQLPLREALNATCDLMYQMLASKGKVTNGDVRGIAGWVFALAVELKWLPRPFDPDEDLPEGEGADWMPTDDMTWLGYDYVDIAYREEFVSLIYEKLSSFEPMDLIARLDREKDEQAAKVSNDPHHDQPSSAEPSGSARPT